MEVKDMTEKAKKADRTRVFLKGPEDGVGYLKKNRWSPAVKKWGGDYGTINKARKMSRLYSA